MVEFEKKDRYGRVIGKVLLDGADMNLRQVEAGYAWWYEYYKRDQSEADQRAYSAAEQQARDSGIGLWSEPAPINPYDWRQGKRGWFQPLRPSLFSAAKSNTARRCPAAPRRSSTWLAAV